MKKTIPLNILKTVEPLLKENFELLSIHHENDTHYTIIDKDKNSQFFYKIFKGIPSNISTTATGAIYIERFPVNENALSIKKTIVTDSNFKQDLETWINIIKNYNSTDSIYDDAILKSFQKEFFDDFELIDEDADYAPFKSKQLFWIDTYLQKLSEDLNSAKNSQNESFINSLQNEVVELNNEITTISKKQLLKRIASVWAKIQKHGMSLAKEFLTEAKKEVIKGIIKKSIELGSGKISEIGGTIIDIIK